VLPVISTKACTVSKVDERSETKILGEPNVLGICVVPCRLILYAVWLIQFAAFVMVPILLRDIIGSISLL
jgi:type III secretory pathway component EscR